MSCKSVSSVRRTARIPNLKEHLTPSMDFHASVKLTSKFQQYDPVTIVKKLRRNQIDHLHFDRSLFTKTSKMLGGLMRTMEPAKT